MYYLIRCKKHLTQADVAELVDALDLGSSIFDVRVRVSPSAYIALCAQTHKKLEKRC